MAFATSSEDKNDLIGEYKLRFIEVTDHPQNKDEYAATPKFEKTFQNEVISDVVTVGENLLVCCLNKFEVLEVRGPEICVLKVIWRYLPPQVGQILATC
jgi:hypothetical protein